MKGIVYKPAVKGSAFILSVLSILMSIIGIYGVLVCSENGLYAGQETEGITSCYQDDVDSIFNEYLYQGEDEVLSNFASDATNLRFILVHGDETISNLSADENLSYTDTYYISYVSDEKGNLIDYTYGRYANPLVSEWYGSNIKVTESSMTIKLGIATPTVINDRYAQVLSILEKLKSWKYAFIWIATTGLILFILGNTVFLYGCGRKAGSTEIVSGWQENVPFDLYLLLFGGGAVLLYALMALSFSDLLYNTDYLFLSIILGSASMCAGALLSEMVIASSAIRFKSGKWWENTIIWKIFGPAIRFCIRNSKKFYENARESVREFFSNLPDQWQAVAGMAGILFGEFFLTVLLLNGASFFFVLIWILYNAAVLLIVSRMTAQLRTVREAAREMANGNLDYRIKDKNMPKILSEHADNLNAIGEGMARAVEQKTRSERMKTELITNVSHDIKTPLTSIVNYVDLLSKEKPENERMQEYIEVLSRQSRRLRKLIEDLVEASKASTGNLTVDLQPCELGVLIEQTVGEYQERLEQSGLTLVVETPEEPIHVMADPRRIWRVLDNLMGNICKYALSGTRVYITLEQKERAKITLRNISRDRLEISPEELTERFVRGDSSRKTEGSGLGLSIAKSLMELQKGTLTIQIDGDLFKAILELPTISPADMDQLEEK